MAQRYEYQDIDGHVILLFVHPATFNEFYPIPLLFQKKLVALPLNSVATAVV